MSAGDCVFAFIAGRHTRLTIFVSSGLKYRSALAMRSSDLGGFRAKQSLPSGRSRTDFFFRVGRRLLKVKTGLRDKAFRISS